MGKFLRKAYDMRQKGNYEMNLISEEEAKEMLENARKFVKDIETYLKNTL